MTLKSFAESTKQKLWVVTLLLLPSISVTVTAIDSEKKEELPVAESQSIDTDVGAITEEFNKVISYTEEAKKYAERVIGAPAQARRRKAYAEVDNACQRINFELHDNTWAKRGKKSPLQGYMEELEILTQKKQELRQIISDYKKDTTEANRLLAKATQAKQEIENKAKKISAAAIENKVEQKKLVSELKKILACSKDRVCKSNKVVKAAEFKIKETEDTEKILCVQGGWNHTFREIKKFIRIHMG